MSAQVGQRIQARYIKHPAPATGSEPWSNGTTYDAGTIQAMDSNVSHLAYESCRHIATVAPFSVATVASSSKVYDGLEGWTAPDGVTFVPHMEIPWDRRTAVCIGPFNLVQDELAASGETVPRKLAVQVDVTNAGSTLNMYYALTLDRSAESLFRNGGIDIDGTSTGCIKHATVTTTTAETVSMVPTLAIGSAASQSWSCRRASSLRSGLVQVIPGYVWVGFRAVGGTVTINAINVYEVR